MSGKNKCKILKQIRQKIAQENDIAYVTSECKHQGNCSGTCPKCEAEVQHLEKELKKRQNAGKAVAVAGIAAALVVGSAGCTWDAPMKEEPLAGDVPYYEPAETVATEETEPLETAEMLLGDVAGEVAYEEETTDKE